MNINKTLLTLVTSLQLSFTAIAGQAEIDQIEQATASLNISGLQNIQMEMAGYDKALAYYRTGLSANLMGQEQLALTSINQAIELLEQLDTATPNDVEIKALLAQVYGYKIALKPMQGMSLGKKSNQTLAAAEALAPNNPRVLLVKGISKLNTPAMFGGSTEAAYQAFADAIANYPSDVNSGYHWGHAETYTWRGLVNMQQGQTELAKQDWQAALEIDPNYGWAHMLLSKNN